MYIQILLFVPPPPPEKPRDIAFIPSVLERVQRRRVSWIRSIAIGFNGAEANCRTFLASYRWTARTLIYHQEQQLFICCPFQFISSRVSLYDSPVPSRILWRYNYSSDFYKIWSVIDNCFTSQQKHHRSFSEKDVCPHTLTQLDSTLDLHHEVRHRPEYKGKLLWQRLQTSFCRMLENK